MGNIGCKQTMLSNAHQPDQTIPPGGLSSFPSSLPIVAPSSPSLSLSLYPQFLSSSLVQHHLPGTTTSTPSFPLNLTFPPSPPSCLPSLPVFSPPPLHLCLPSLPFVCPPLLIRHPSLPSQPAISPLAPHPSPSPLPLLPHALSHRKPLRLVLKISR